jgi:hypothetical protein
MVGILQIKHTYKYLDGKIIHQELIPFDRLDEPIKRYFNIGATKIEITYTKTQGIYEIDK